MIAVYKTNLAMVNFEYMAQIGTAFTVSREYVDVYVDLNGQRRYFVAEFDDPHADPRYVEVSEKSIDLDRFFKARKVKCGKHRRKMARLNRLYEQQSPHLPF